MKASLIASALASTLCVLPGRVHAVERSDEIQEMLTGEPETLPPIVFKSSYSSSSSSSSPHAAKALGDDTFEIHLKKDRRRLAEGVRERWYGLEVFATDGITLRDISFSGGPEDADGIVCRFGCYKSAPREGYVSSMERTRDFVAGEVVSADLVSMAYCEATWYEDRQQPSSPVGERDPPRRRQQ